MKIQARDIQPINTDTDTDTPASDGATEVAQDGDTLVIGPPTSTRGARRAAAPLGTASGAAARLADALREAGYAGARSSAEVQAVLEAWTPATQRAVERSLQHGAVHDIAGPVEGLTTESWLKLLTVALGYAATTSAKAVSLSALNASLGAEAGEVYRTRVLERWLRETSIEALVDLRNPRNEWGRWTLEPGAVPQFNAALTKRARLIAALGAGLEQAASAEGHTALKSLLDAFALRTDEFDRVGNESLYLQRMFNGRDDKAIMMDYVRPGNILEVGPAGCAVLELLQPFAASSRIIGLDLSEEALKTLAQQREREGLHYELVRGDALDMRQVVKAQALGGLDTVIFCSVLHEVFSYTVHEGRQFNPDAVRTALRGAIASLNPGGRIIIRDWAVPADAREPRRLVLKTDAASEYFDAFVTQFRGHDVAWEEVGRDSEGQRVVTLSAGDCMEFMYKLSWGPASFPYEVREQYGVFTQQEYIDVAHEAARELGVSMKLELERAYLQEGYKKALQDAVGLDHLDGTPAPWPPSKMLLVFTRQS
jgi:SAM-dependent methyltransferase